jgi:DNA-binding protein YbaB
MTTPYDQQVEELLDQYRKQREEMAEMQRQLDDTTATVTAPKQVVKVTVGAQGQVNAIEFPTSAYRRLPPKELADTLLNTIQQARAKALEKTNELVSARLPAGVTMTDLLQGKANPMDLLSEDPAMPDSVRDYIDHGRIEQAAEADR